MNYELAKQLKDSGYPQKYHPFTGLMYEEASPNIPLHHFNDKGCYCPDCTGEPFCVVPTLSELISACDGYFLKLERIYTGNKWDAGAGFADSPEEAVAMLYLKINSHTNEVSDN